jgi:hypothetical protein
MRNSSFENKKYLFMKILYCDKGSVGVSVIVVVTIVVMIGAVVVLVCEVVVAICAVVVDVSVLSSRVLETVGVIIVDDIEVVVGSVGVEPKKLHPQKNTVRNAYTDSCEPSDRWRLSHRTDGSEQRDRWREPPVIESKID